MSRACVNGLVFGGHLEPLPSRPRDLRSGSRFLDEHVRFADVELRRLTLTSKRIRQWGEGWERWRWLSGREAGAAAAAEREMGAAPGVDREEGFFRVREALFFF